MGDTAVDFLLEYLKQLMMNCKEIEYNQFPEAEKLQIESLYEDLISLRTFLKDSEMIWYKREVVKDLVFRITDMGNEAQDIIDDSIVSDIIEKTDGVGGTGTFHHVYKSGILIDVLKEIKCLKKDVSKIYENKLYAIGRDPPLINVPNQMTAADFLLEHLKKLMMNCKEIDNQFPEVEKLRIKSVYEDLSSLRTFLKDSETIWYKHEEVKDLVFRITDMGNEAQDIIHSSIVSDFIKSVRRLRVLEYRSFTYGMLINLQNEIGSLKKVVSDEGCNLSLRASVDSVLEYFMELMKVAVFDDLEVEACFRDLSTFRTTFLKDDSSEMSWYKHEELKDLLTQITDMANEAVRKKDDDSYSIWEYTVHKAKRSEYHHH